ncbi:MAG: SAM hydrolase/SAM-dependent halogenase family protein [Oscillospiraceae bacterium]|jgi:S-adenosylmethionine hydrolase
MRNLVIQTDFGTGSLSVSAMHGVCAMVDPELKVNDGNNDVVQFDVLNASDSLIYLLPYWPKGTVFVSVVDPGVGTARKSCVAKLSDGQFVVTPDNGTLTYVKEQIGIEEVREIDESVNRLPGSEDIHIFHGRDVYAYCGARLAAGVIDFEGVGPAYPVSEIVTADYIKPEKAAGMVSGMINEATEHFGLVGTNIPFSWMEDAGMKYGDDVEVIVEKNGEKVLDKVMKFAKSFGYVPVGDPLVFSSETRTVMLAINRGNATIAYKLGFGPDWKMTVRKSGEK